MTFKVPFNRPSLIGKEVQYIAQAIDNGQLSGNGYFTKECNVLINKMAGSKAAMLTHSCTAALEMAAILCDLEAGDEVIMPSFTFVSTANAVALRGAVPVFVDIDETTLNIDPARVSEAVTSKTKAIMAVHYAGFPADMDKLSEIAKEHDLFLIEDAAQALGSTYKGRPAGGLGDIAAFSFHETKNVITGEGGALTISRQELIERAEIILEKGTNRTQFINGQTDKYTWVDIGSSFLPGELVAAFLYGQLAHASEVKKRRLNLFNRYMDAFKDQADREIVKLPKWQSECVGNGHMFYLIMRDHAEQKAFINHMRNAGIITPFHYVPLHSSPAGKKFSVAHGDLKNTNETYERLVRLPLFYDLDNDIEYVIEIAQSYFNQKRERG